MDQWWCGCFFHLFVEVPKSGAEEFQPHHPKRAQALHQLQRLPCLVVVRHLKVTATDQVLLRSEEEEGKERPQLMVSELEKKHLYTWRQEPFSTSEGQETGNNSMHTVMATTTTEKAENGKSTENPYL
jgi:hypothetical protein